jgi:hypothetical protein
MFTDFSSYSRQNKTIRPLSAVQIDQYATSGCDEPVCHYDSAGQMTYCDPLPTSCAKFTDPSGNITKITSDNPDPDEASKEVERAYDELTRSNVINTAPTNYDTTQYPTNPSTPTTPTTPDTGYKGSTTPNKPTPDPKPKTGGGGGGGGGMPMPDPATPTDFSKTGQGVAPEISAPSSSTGQGTNMTTDFSLQSDPAYYGQSGSNPATYPAVGTTTPITPSGASDWVTDYNSVGFMKNDPIMGGSYSAPSAGNFSTTQGTNPATQVGVAYPLQQSIYDTYTNVTGAGNQVYMGGSPSFNEATGQYVNATSNTIANPTSLPTALSAWDLFGTAGASSGLFLDTPTIKQGAVATTSAVDTTASVEPKQGGLGLLAGGLIALKLLSVI